MSNNGWFVLKAYQDMKTKYEKEYFKLGGDYAWFDGDKLTKRSVNQIREYFKNKKIRREITDVETGETKIVERSFYNVWSEDPKMREYTEVVHSFDQTKVLPHQFNIFTGFNVEKIERDETDITKELAILNEHLKSLCNYNDQHVELLKWFIAGMFKNPLSLPPICLVFISKEGVGKDMLYELIEMMINERSTFNVDQLDKVVGRFNSVLGGKLFGVINETDPKDSAERRDNIKYLITAKKVEIEGKHKDPVKTINCCRLMFFANRLCAFPLEKGARRPYIINPSEKYLTANIGADANKKHFDRLADVMKNPQVQRAFYDELMKIDIVNYNFRNVIHSELHEALVEAVKPPLAEFVSQLCYSNIKKDMFSIETQEFIQLYNNYMAKNNMKFESSMKSVKVDLEMIYGVKKFPSDGKYKFRFHTKAVIEILQKEYNIKVGDDDNCLFKVKSDDDEDEERVVEDKAVTIRIDEHKKITDSFINEISHLKDSNELLNEDLIQALKYIKELEARCYKLETHEKQPTKKANKSKTKIDDIVEVADNVIINKNTNEEYKIETIDADDNDFFN